MSTQIIVALLPIFKAPIDKKSCFTLSSLVGGIERDHKFNLIKEELSHVVARDPVNNTDPALQSSELISV
nr:hypothetical protein CFP56_38293 [Quercus suber]